MKTVLPIIKKHRLITLNIITLAAAFFSFRYYIERLLSPKLGMGWSYVLDQATPFVIAVLTTFFLLRKRVNFKIIHTKLKNHYRLLSLIFIVAFVTHLGILYYFFWSDEVYFILTPITQNKDFFFHTVQSKMRGYFIESYALTYLLFGTRAWVYPLFSITYFAISALFVYWFLYLLTNKKLVAGLASVFLATTPAFLDMFTWHSTAHAPILILGLASLILLLYYKKDNRFVYYVLSLIFFFSAIKMGFIRSAGLTLIPLLLLFLPLYKNTKMKLPDLVLYALPYIMIAIYFVSFEFINKELENAMATFWQTRNINQALTHILEYRNVTENSLLFFFAKLSFFSAHLFVPNGLTAEVIPLFHRLFPKISLALVIGNLSLVTLFLSFLVGLKFRYTKKGWLVVFAVIFIVFNMLHSIIGYQGQKDFDPSVQNFAKILDAHFALEGIGYGPGSRYLFISTIGVGLMFALFIDWFSKKGKIFTIIAVFICTSVLGGNSYFTLRAQVQNLHGMRIYKSLVENIFKTVPRDGKPKILFSANPQMNGIDTKFTGWMWLHGFYKVKELTYAKDDLTFTNDQPHIQELIKSGQYARENLYAFFNNPGTLAFKDISEEARNYFFPNSEKRRAPTFLKFQSQKESTQITHEETMVNKIERAVTESQDINQRSLGSQSLKFKLKMQGLENLPYPLSDTIVFEPNGETRYNFPLKLWERVALPPQITSNPGVIKPINDKNYLQILNIIKDRENLMIGTTINVSSIEKGHNITKESLIDGLYTTYPRPNLEERYFMAGENPVIINFSFPYTSYAKRILLNTPLMNSANSPRKVIISASQDNQRFQQVITSEDLISNEWSPNRGPMLRIDFPKAINTRYLRLEIWGNNSLPIALDEIVVDGEKALLYSPQDIHDTAKLIYHYVDNKETFKQLAEIKRYDRLTVLWACAEDSDWNKQLKNKLEQVPGIWNVAKVNIPHGAREVEDSVTINCYGSKLRQVFFISPPYPVEMEIVEAVIK